MITKFKSLAPGFALVLAIALVSRILHGVLPQAARAVMGEVIIALLIGLIISNMKHLSPVLRPGIDFSFKVILKWAIVLLGAKFSLQKVAEIGGSSLLLILVLIALALSIAHFLGKMLGISPKLATLIGVGTAICGNTAITVTAPVIQAKDEEVSFAIATNTFFGTVAVFFYPILGHMLGLSDDFFGTWAGVAVNDTSQVVAAGFSYSEAAGELATAVKLTRNALMGFVIVAIGFAHSKGHPDWGDMSMFAKMKKSVPFFVIGFMIMAVLNTLGVFNILADALGRPILKDFTFAAKFMILLALAGVGLNTRFDNMRKIGLTPFFIGLAAATTTAVVSFFAIRMFW